MFSSQLLFKVESKGGTGSRVIRVNTFFFRVNIFFVLSVQLVSRVSLTGSSFLFWFGVFRQGFSVSPCLSQACSVEQADLKLTEIHLPLPPQMLGLKVSVPPGGVCFFFKNDFVCNFSACRRWHKIVSCHVGAGN